MVAGLFILERTCTLNEPTQYIYIFFFFAGFELKKQHETIVVRFYYNIDI